MARQSRQDGYDLLKLGEIFIQRASSNMLWAKISLHFIPMRNMEPCYQR